MHNMLLLLYSKNFNSHYIDEVADDTLYEVMSLHSLNVTNSGGNLECNVLVRNDDHNITTAEIPNHDTTIKMKLLAGDIINKVCTQLSVPRTITKS